MHVNHDTRHRTTPTQDASDAASRPGQPRHGADPAEVAAFVAALGKDARSAALQAGVRESMARETQHESLAQESGEAGREPGDAPIAPASAAELAALWAAQRSSASAPTPQVAAHAAAALPRATFAELVEKHVRQLLVSAPTSDGEARVLLRLDEASLPDTDLWLSQTGGRWTLHAETSRADSHALLEACAPMLVQRFADGALGAIDVQTSLR